MEHSMAYCSNDAEVNRLKDGFKCLPFVSGYRFSYADIFDVITTVFCICLLSILHLLVPTG